MSESPTNLLNGSNDAEQVVLPFWHAPAEFALHALVGTCIFAIIALPAVLLDLATKKLEGIEASMVVIYGIKFAEYSLFGTDLFLLLIFLAKTGWRTAKKL
jgi:hypothetical protein